MQPDKVLVLNFNVVHAEDASQYPKIATNELPGEWKVTRHAYGIVLEEQETGGVEQAFYITYSGGQSGDAVWSVTLMGVDMDMKQQHGQCAWKQLPEQINRAVAIMTRDWVAFAEPINGDYGDDLR